MSEQPPSWGTPDPYGQQPVSHPYGQPTSDPYGQPETNPYDGHPGYGAPGGPRRDPRRRPGTVLAAGIITLVTAGLSLLLFAVVFVALLVARDDALGELEQDESLQDLMANPEDVYTVVLVSLAVFALWSAASMLLAVLALRRSNLGRILLVVSSGLTALVSLLAITSVVTALTLAASVTVIALLFTGGANEWFSRRDDAPVLPVGTTQPWGD